MAPLAATLGAVRGRASSYIVIRTSLLQVQPVQITLPTRGQGPQRHRSGVQRRDFSSGTVADPEARPPFPPFTFETAKEKVRKAQDAWNTRNPDMVAMAYTPDSRWRNRETFLQGREAIKTFLSNKWAKEIDYCLMKELWGFHGNRISARFEYEWHDGQGQWWRSHGNEQWEFNAKGLMQRRDASINDVRIKASDRRYIRNPKTGLVEFPQGHPADNSFPNLGETMGADPRARLISHSLCPIDFFATSNTQVTTTQEVKTYLPEEPSASASAAAMDIIANGEQKNGAPPASLSLPGCGAGAAADGGAASTAGEEQASSLPMASPHSSSSADDPSTVRLLTRQTGKPLKLKRLLAVDLPVLCSSPMTAVSMLGGMDRLSAACTGNARKLHFYFRPEDKLSIPVPSQGKIPSSRLLLRVRLRKDGTTGDRTVVAKEVVGTISTTFQFTALADFQYLTTQAFLPVGTADVVSKTRLEIVPSSFVPVAHAGNYAYTSLKSSALANQDTARRQGVVIKFGCPIPKAPPAMLVNRPRRRLEKYGQVLEKLQALFDRTRGGREMWQRKALESKFEGDDLHAFLELLRVVAYNMSNGPWRGFWVKYGYDPSQDSVARLYQALDVRWKEAGLEKLKTSYGEVWKKVRAEAGREDEEEEGVEELKLFGLPVRRQMVFQLCDLGSASLQRLVLAVPRKAECTAQGGWFRLSDLTVLRGKIKRYLSGKVAECVRTGSVEPVTGGRGGKGGREEGALSPGEMILEAEARRGEEVVLPERGSGGSKGGGRGEGEGAGINGAAGVDGEREREECDGVMAAATRKSKRKATGGGRGGGIGGRGRGGRSKKKARRVGGEAEETHESESDEEEEEKKEGRYQNRGERDEEESYGQGRGDEEGMEDEEEAGARQLERLFGQPGRRTVDRARANTAAVTRGRTRHQGGDEDKEDDLGRTFVIPLTAGDVQNASSIRLLGGYQGADYSSSSSDDDDGSD